MSISQKMHFSSYPHWTTNTRTALAFVFHFSPRGQRPLRNLCLTLLFVLPLASLPPGPKPFAKIVCVLCFFFICLSCFYFAFLFFPRSRSPSRTFLCVSSCLLVSFVLSPGAEALRENCLCAFLFVHLLKLLLFCFFLSPEPKPLAKISLCFVLIPCLFFCFPPGPKPFARIVCVLCFFSCTSPIYASDYLPVQVALFAYGKSPRAV